MSFLSQRVTHLEESATLAMSRKAREMKQQGIPVISLSLGEPDFRTPSHICEAAIQAIQERKWFGYPPVAGYEDVREAIASKLQNENHITAHANEIVISTGAKQSIHNIFAALLNPGDDILLPVPYWVSYHDMAKLYGANPVPVPTYLADGYKLQAEVLAGCLTKKSKLLVFSSPCNPTGAVLEQADLAAIAQVIQNYPNLFIVSDEIYEHINFTGTHASLGAFESIADRVITVNGLSKSFAMTGWRIGYMRARQEIAKACEKLQGQCTSGANSIAQRSILAALNGTKVPAQHMCNTYQKRKDDVLKRLRNIPDLGVYEPQGAYYVFPDVQAYLGRRIGEKVIENVNDMAMYLLEEAHVATVSGLAFGSKHAIRLSFATSDENIQEALNRIEAALRALQP